MSLTYDQVQQFNQEFQADPGNVLNQNNVSTRDLLEACASRQSVQQLDFIFSNEVTPQPKATDQKASGRCWIFAALNVLRTKMMQKYNLANFEFSQSYMFFYDKLERANYFMENILETKDQPVDERLVSFLLTDPLGDGGQWDMIVNLVNKYGLVPKAAFQESWHSEHSRRMNKFLAHKLREYAHHLRNSDNAQQLKEQFLQEYHKFLCTFLGTPPSTFDWAYRNKDQQFVQHQGLTPQQFYQEYVDVHLDNYICVIHDPRQEHAYFRKYTVQYLGNVKEGHPVRYLNLPIDRLKELTTQSIDENNPVWFGCDVGQRHLSSKGWMSFESLAYEQVFGTQFTMDKETRLKMGESLMTHAMVLSGYGDQAWKVENSWGAKGANDGYLIMSDDWFNEYVYEVAVDKRLLTPEEIAALESDAVVLPPWDPMGALA